MPINPPAHIIQMPSGQLVWAEAIDEKIVEIEQLKRNLKNYKEMLDAHLVDDADYYNADEAYKESQKLRKQAKARIELEHQELLNHIKVTKEELKEAKEALDVHVVAYRDQTQSYQFTSERTGETYDIELKAKLHKK